MLPQHPASARVHVDAARPRQNVRPGDRPGRALACPRSDERRTTSNGRGRGGDRSCSSPAGVDVYFYCIVLATAVQLLLQLLLFLLELELLQLLVGVVVLE